MRVTLNIGSASVDGLHQVIEGRCIHGHLKVGDRFTTIYTVRLNPDHTTTWIIQKDAIDLRVERLETYGKTMQSIDEGLTLKAWVSGHGFELLTLGHYVSNDNAIAK